MESIPVKTNLLALLFLPILLLPISASTAPPAADTPAVAVVRQFLADRAAGQNEKGYKLLSEASRRRIPAEVFAAGSRPSVDVSLTPVLGALGVFMLDTHNRGGYHFEVLGPAAGQPDTVLVRALPPAGAALTLQIGTVSSAGGSRRIDLAATLARLSPHDRASLSKPLTPQEQSQRNLKQIAVAVIKYLLDHDERYPDAAKWMDELRPYLKDPAVFHDPSAPAGQKWSYAYNRALSHASPAEAGLESKTIVVFESTKGTRNASDLGQSVPRPGRHSGGTNYAFADAHVQWFRDGTKLTYALPWAMKGL